MSSKVSFFLKKNNTIIVLMFDYEMQRLGFQALKYSVLLTFTGIKKFTERCQAATVPVSYGAEKVGIKKLLQRHVTC